MEERFLSQHTGIVWAPDEGRILARSEARGRELGVEHQSQPCDDYLKNKVSLSWIQSALHTSGFQLHIQLNQPHRKYLGEKLGVYGTRTDFFSYIVT